VLAVLSLVVGNTVALVQTNIKRLLAYSTISNVGFILLGFVAGHAGRLHRALYYTLVYVLVVLGSFGVILLLSRRATRPTSSMTSRACTNAIRCWP
jgi:NADH-quinone oxidoreductase subunit N